MEWRPWGTVIGPPPSHGPAAAQDWRYHRLAALMRRLSNEWSKSGADHRANTIETPKWIDRQRSGGSALLEDEQLETIGCESAEAAIGGRSP
jgi:hypothetical protein